MDDVRWYLAATVTERIAVLARHAPGEHPDHERGQRRLQRWEDRPYHDPVAFAEWSARLGMNRASWEWLASASADDLRRAFADPPGWLRRLWETLDLTAGHDAVATTEPRPSDQASPAAQAGSARTLLAPELSGAPVIDVPPLLTPVAPLVSAASAELTARVEKLLASAPVAQDTGRLAALLVASWPRAALARIVLRLAVLEMHIARLEGRLRAGDSRERFEEFVSGFRAPCTAARLFAEYPAAARECQRTLDRWIDARAEFAQHLLADLPLLAAHLGEVDLDRIREISFELGDGHRGGRSVGLVTFERGVHAVYKPRSLQVDQHFQALLRWSGTRGFTPALRPLWIVDRVDHGWMEYVPGAPCADRAAAGRFYRRQGASLALLYLLGGRDMHRENLIADGEYPVLVDLEGLFHAEPVRRHDQDRDADMARQLLLATVLATGLLPNPRTYRQNGRIGRTDFSGLSEAVPLSPEEVIVWDGVGTDDMRVVRRRVELAAARHAPVVDGRVESVLAHGDDLERGFRDMYALLLAHRDELRTRAGPLARFAHAPVRVLLRSTQTYSDVLDQSYHPDLLRDALDRDHYIGVTFAGPAGLVDEELLGDSERRQIADGDIPLFTATARGRDLVGGDGTRIPEVLEQSGLDAALARLRALSERDLERQVWIVRAALSTAGLEGVRPEWPMHTVSWAHHDLRDSELLDAAVALGDQVLEQAVPLGDALGWLGIRPLEGDHWQLKGIGSDLYSGVSGIALFFTYLGQVSGERRFRDAARGLVGQLAAWLARLSGWSPSDADGLLGMSGAVDGPLYALAHWAAVSGDTAPVASACEAVLAPLEQAVQADGTLDLIGGATATVLALDAMHDVYPDSRVRAVLDAAATRIVTSAQRGGGLAAWPLAQFDGRALTGVSHGASGMALALARAWRRGGRPAWRYAAVDALSYERRRFDATLPGWRDLRPGVTGPGTTTAWCHGAPGIGVVRLALAEAVPEVGAADDIPTAVSATLAHYDRCRKGEMVRLGNLSLCHGEIGNIEFLAWAGRHLNDSALVRRVRRLCTAVLDLAERHGWLCGVPHGVSNPGLMTGLSGIGYGLLRLAAPDRVPSVLTLDRPTGPSRQPARRAASLDPWRPRC